MRAFRILAFAAFATVLATAQTKTSKDLQVYVIDVEGGNATLFVAPSRESLLIDTGNAGAVAAPRDAGRIVEAIKDAGLQQIDHLITTHWHGDHFGGMAELAKQVPIREFIDHGPNVQPGELADTFLQKTYPQLYAKAKHTVAKPGDKISMDRSRCARGGFRGRDDQDAVARRGQAESLLRQFQARREQCRRPAIRRRSSSRLGKFRTIHLGDLTKNKEFELMCPNNRLGTVDVLLGSASRQAQLEFGGAGARPASARRHHE